MSKIVSTIKKARNPRRVLLFMLRHTARLWKNDAAYQRVFYYISVGKKLNLTNPRTFNEKLQWLKLNNRRAEYTTLVDKYAVKQYLKTIGGGELLIPTIDIYDDVSQIDFNKLPNRFVLKCTHDSGGRVICKDKSKLNIEEAKKKLSKGMKRSYFYQTREYPYKNVKPRIIAEKYMEDRNGELNDYKFFCFDGEVKCLYVATDRKKGNDQVKFDFFDTKWNHLPFTNAHPNSAVPLEKPENFDEMLKIASRLSKGFPFIRVDLYNCDGKIYFGEFTFFHMGGNARFVPEEWDYKLGEWIHLPKGK